MNKPQQKVLLMSAGIGKTEQLRDVLPRLGFRLLSAETPAAAAALCRQHDVDLIITGTPDTDSTHSFIPRDCPAGIPILYLTSGPIDLTDLPEFCSILTNPSDDTVITQVKLLSQISALKRILADKERKIEELDHLLGQQRQSMKQHSDFLDVLASRDGLTGLYNRRHLNKVLTREFELAAEQQTNLSLLILDLDFFDELNQRAGRSYGDFVLNDFAARLTSMTTPKGFCFRFSGEVFIALLPDTDLDEAVDAAESIRRNLAEKPFIRGTEQHQITLSVGAAALIEHQPTDPDHLITMAERALFLAKSEGRNRVVSFSPVDRSGSSTSQQSMTLVKETLSKILDKTRKSAIESLQLLAKDIAG
ncbi:MAG: GGDEF domain-containing protein, partial [Desulfofustis sp.]|nr:GGDEF domain-containing protein [Desulfofustis sp.]